MSFWDQGFWSASFWSYGFWGDEAVTRFEAPNSVGVLQRFSSAATRYEERCWYVMSDLCNIQAKFNEEAIEVLQTDDRSYNVFALPEAVSVAVDSAVVYTNVAVPMETVRYGDA